MIWRNLGWFLELFEDPFIAALYVIVAAIILVVSWSAYISDLYMHLKEKKVLKGAKARAIKK